MIHSIPTVYRGIEFRSRLEAKWAAFFDEIRWHHTYEPFDGAGYLPDFLIHGGAEPLLVEIKPAVTYTDYCAPLDKIEAGLSRSWEHGVLVLGADPLPTELENWYDHAAAGMLGQYVGTIFAMTLGGIRIDNADVYRHLTTALQDQVVHGEIPNPDPHWDYATGCWIRCRKCRKIGVYQQERMRTAYPCGHYDGAANLGRVEAGVIELAWAAACNEVKWRGRDAVTNGHSHPNTGVQNAPIPDIPPPGITPSQWRDLPIQAKQTIANVAAGIGV